MIEANTYPPGLPLIVAGLLLPLLPAVLRPLLVLGAPILSVLLVLATGDGPQLTHQWLGHTLVPVAGDDLSRLFGLVFSLVAVTGAVFALGQSNRLEIPAAFVYGGAAISAVFAGDLITLFVFWEVMAIASTLVVFAGGPAARGAGLRYAAIHFLGGVLLMAGIAGEVASTGSIAFVAFDISTWPRVLMLAGILINAGAPPLAAWLPDSYPEASWSGMVFLSAFTTKTAVYALIRGFPGVELLVPIGLFMVFYGIVFAILENDVRRVLAYSIVNHVGFMVTAVGVGTTLALNGAAAHAFAHILYKTLLVMAAGSVLLMTGKRKCTDLGGLFRTMPLTCLFTVIGALSLAAFPFTAGFSAKSLITASVAEAHLATVWFLLAAASAGAMIYAGLKLPWFVFFDRDSGLRPAEPPLNMLAVMALLSVACIAVGVAPRLLYDLLPHPVDYEPNTASHIVYQLQLLLFSGLAFFLMLGWLRRTLTITLDFDWLWRRPGAWVAATLWMLLSELWRFGSGVVRASGSYALDTLTRQNGPHGLLGRQWPTGSMAFWTTVLLGGSLLAYYWQ
ncbi:MAG: Na(+)/H(+) antiporter subunit D [Rhizobiales bacterium]|nr:Na(+)/H(+) antiporter subunit D [Hyphomicrobiales bacterium]